MNKRTYYPNPIDTASIDIPAELQDLVEDLAKHVHAIWAKKRIEDGWKWGPERNDIKQLHPDLIPYEQLSEKEKQYDRETAKETIKAVLQLGYKIENGN